MDLIIQPRRINHDGHDDRDIAFQQDSWPSWRRGFHRTSDHRTAAG
jgi:hypothetical protein